MRRVGYVLSAAGQGFWRNPVMSLASTFTVTLMLAPPSALQPAAQSSAHG